ncbi:glycosyltransferase family 4 protein [Alkalihalobacillus hwajinpoensis]|uniref:glycosyltransferase family 4 protein n=1 Tax=Guptibacillus hwajinpoensis TaxID=208199 RepID=UPI0018848FCB|nr:glycosyltransferase family 4 protein [Pseudalkalibacillus hwajinpoensis]MBF0705384.1 glycosyltransferase family 4 protein [Pseudalkalibacillus hwajinpoensis]
MEKQIFICGNFGYENNQLDGQTIKTRVLKEELEKRINTNIVFTDTSYIKKNPISVLKDIFKKFIRSSHIIIMPDSRALKVLLPFYILLNNKKRDIRYVVIGGWLPSFLEANSIYRILCAKLNGIYVEANEMKNRMEKIGLNNIKVLPNFRDFSVEKKQKKGKHLPLRLVYFSRVIKEKGVELAIAAINELNKKETVVMLDIFGPLIEEYKPDFLEIMKNQGKEIEYKGYLEPDEIHEKLSEYDAMILPTYFSSEGFPGAVIDAYISGLPVLASDWKYNKEFVIDNYTGLIFKVKDIEDIIKKIEIILTNSNLLESLKENSLKQSLKYHVDFVIPEIIKDMNIDKT